MKIEPVIYTITIEPDTVKEIAEEYVGREITEKELIELMEVAKGLLEGLEQGMYDDYRLEEDIEQWFDEAEYRDKEEGNG